MRDGQRERVCVCERDRSWANHPNIMIIIEDQPPTYDRGKHQADHEPLLIKRLSIGWRSDPHMHIPPARCEPARGGRAEPVLDKPWVWPAGPTQAGLLDHLVKGEREEAVRVWYENAEP